MSNLFNLSVPEDCPPILKAAFIRARKINAEDWKDEQAEPRAVFHGGYGDDTWDSAEEFMEAVSQMHQEGESWPTWVWGTQEVQFKFSAEALLEDHFGTSEDVPPMALKELDSLLDGWRTRWINEATMDAEDTSVVVMLPEEWWK